MNDEALRKELREVIGLEAHPSFDSDVPGKIVRLCRAAGTEFHQTLHLVVRSAWLEQLDASVDLDQNPTETGKSSNAENKRRFNPDPIKLFEAFEDNACGWAVENGYDQEMFNLLVAEMIASNLFLFGGKSAEVECFAERAQRHNTMLLREDSLYIVESFMAIKARWLNCQDELGDRILVTEGLRLRNAKINRQWLKVYGAEYVCLLAEESRLDICRQKITILALHTQITAAELDEKMRELMQNERKRLESIRLKASMALQPDIEASGGLVIDSEGIKNYRQQSKKILREIYLSIHPDALSQNPAYGNLTERQKIQLMVLWNEVMEIRDEEVGFNPNCLGYTHRSNAILMEKLDYARGILHNAGLEIDPRCIIQGDSLAEQIEWLNRSIVSLESAILSAQAEQMVLLEDQATRERAAMLEWAEFQQEKIRRAYRDQAENCKVEADKLETIIVSRLAGREP